VIAFFDAGALISVMVPSALIALAQAHPSLGVAMRRMSWLDCRVGPMKGQRPGRSRRLRRRLCAARSGVNLVWGVVPPLEQRWFPADESLRERAYEMLLPPLVSNIRREVQAWRDAGYAGAPATSTALLRW
jgi:hypothetical protein